MDICDRFHLFDSFTDYENVDKIRYNFYCVKVDVGTDGCDVYIEHVLDPPSFISGEESKELPKKQRLFWALVNAVNYINELKNNKK